jgi:hypothetical protein
MGWGTSFKTEIYLSRQIFSSKYELEEKIEENKKWISNSIEKLKMFAAANPKDIVDPEWKEEPINWLSNQIDNLMEGIEEFSFENYRLEMYLDYINEECNGEIIPRKPEL